MAVWIDRSIDPPVGHSLSPLLCKCSSCDALMFVPRCRRAVMAVHFDEVWDDEECNQTCDVCRHGNGEYDSLPLMYICKG